LQHEKLNMLLRI